MEPCLSEGFSSHSSRVLLPLQRRQHKGTCQSPRFIPLLKTSHKRTALLPPHHVPQTVMSEGTAVGCSLPGLHS